MELVHKLLAENDAALVWSDVQRENRLRSIAFNATQQARIPFGRGDDPFTDADAQTSQDIYMILLRLERKAEVNVEQQHQLLTPVAKPDSDAVLARVADVIAHPTDAEWRPSGAEANILNSDDAA
jgi:hypothetical protein